MKTGRYMFWVMGALMAAVTQAGEPQRLRLPADSVRSSLGTGMRVHGLPLRAEVFQIPASLRETADLIASQAPALPSLSVLPGALLLAWQSGSEHWLVRLTHAGETLTRGVVSVLTLVDDDNSARVAQHAPAWLPAQAKLLLRLDNLDGPQRVQQDVYAHDLPPSRLWPRVYGRLRESGWQRQSDGVHASIERWQQGSHMLMLQVVPVSGGSGVVAVQSWPK